MPLINRGSLGAEFLDLTSMKLLRQPEPQYPYAQLWKMALNAGLEKVSGSLGWRTPEIGVDGAGYPEADADRLILDDPIYRDTIVVVPELGNGYVGHTVRMNRPLFANTTYTLASREINPNNAISTLPINVGSEQVSITLKMFGGPYDQTNGNVAPYGVTRFDAKRSMHSLSELVGAQLQRDFDRSIDSFVGMLLNAGASTIWTNGYTSDTQFQGNGTKAEAPFDWASISALERQFDVANVPTFADGYRGLMVSPVAVEQLKQDANFLRSAEYMPPINPILAKSYYKTVGRIHLFKSTTLPTTVNGNGTTVYTAQGFAPGVIGSGIGDMPRVAKSANDNFGEWALVAWLMYAGFALFDNRFAINIHHD